MGLVPEASAADPVPSLNLRNFRPSTDPKAILYLELANQEVTGKAHGRVLPGLGPARLAIATPHLHLFDKSTGLALA